MFLGRKKGVVEDVDVGELYIFVRYLGGIMKKGRRGEKLEWLRCL